MGPGGGLVLKAASAQAAMQDPDQPVRQLPQRGLMPKAAGALPVVIRPSAGWPADPDNAPWA